MATNEPIDLEAYEKQKLLERLGKKPLEVNPLLKIEQTAPTVLTPTPTPARPFENFASPPNPPGPPTPIELQGFNPLYGFKDLVDVAEYIYPDVYLHQWQREELYRLSGYVNGKKSGPRMHWFKHQPFMGSYVCANGSGKDKIILSVAAVGLPLLYEDFFVVLTSSSHEQLKHQTQNHIRRAIDVLNAKLGVTFYEAVEFYACCKARGAEIKLFATDEAGRAEGWHPLTPKGRLFIGINEAKSIAAPILAALDRCRGFSHWVEISSPGLRTGIFYQNFKRSVKYPDIKEALPFKYFARKVTAYDCPHITKEEIDIIIQKHGPGSYIVETSINANFAEENQDVIIPFSFVEACEDVEPKGNDIGIGLDCAAGGDETVLCVRRGNKLIDLFAFTEADINVAATRIDARLSSYKDSQYIFNADDGGVGHGLIDILFGKGWHIYRRHNQAAAFNKKRYLNFGAETYRHVRALFEAKNIIAPKDEKLLLQLCTRRDIIEGQGKFKAESKKRIKELGGESPDRADAFVLCFYSYQLTPLGTPAPTPAPSGFMTTQELIRFAATNPAAFAAMFEGKSRNLGRPTLLK